ncbi:hypothetical protein GNZ12_34910 [Paraburkholderia sp. 1N]|uniref:PNPLA domain-containing protein n=1 Tax=Paraburkholderia solitsugae TaxID=2675748 RepID=A0ABX2C269_9BURK|nr:hypothetical protein [Paraburkholderia solitsugae]
MNAAVLAHGLLTGDSEDAREALHDFWRAVAQSAESYDPFGKIRIFSGQELCTEAVLASASLPTLSQAVEINSEHYWDGGHVGNPVIFPLIYNRGTHDVVIVHINPIVRTGVPTTPANDRASISAGNSFKATLNKPRNVSASSACRNSSDSLRPTLQPRSFGHYGSTICPLQASYRCTDVITHPHPRPSALPSRANCATDLSAEDCRKNH